MYVRRRGTACQPLPGSHSHTHTHVSPVAASPQSGKKWNEKANEANATRLLLNKLDFCLEVTGQGAEQQSGYVCVCVCVLADPTTS